MIWLDVFYIYIHIFVTYIHTLPYLTLPYLTLHYITLHYITLHYIALHYITLHYIHTIQLLDMHMIIHMYIYIVMSCNGMQWHGLRQDEAGRKGTFWAVGISLIKPPRKGHRFELQRWLLMGFIFYFDGDLMVIHSD